MRLIKRNLLVVLGLCFGLALHAQDRTITGTVTAGKDGSPLSGVTVQVKGLATGSGTGDNGAYSINVPAGNYTLIFSIVGYTSVEEAIGNRKTVNVTLTETNQALDEVVVI